MQLKARGFWWWHAVLPGFAFLLLAAVLATTMLDVTLARAWAFDAAAGRFIGGSQWAKIPGQKNRERRKPEYRFP